MWLLLAPRPPCSIRSRTPAAACHARAPAPSAAPLRPPGGCTTAAACSLWRPAAPCRPLQALLAQRSPPHVTPALDARPPGPGPRLNVGPQQAVHAVAGLAAVPTGCPRMLAPAPRPSATTSRAAARPTSVGTARLSVSASLWRALSPAWPQRAAPPHPPMRAITHVHPLAPARAPNPTAEPPASVLLLPLLLRLLLWRLLLLLQWGGCRLLANGAVGLLMRVQGHADRGCLARRG